MTEQKQRHSKLPTSAELFPQSAVSRITGERRAESELGLVTGRLHELTQLRQDSTTALDEHIDELTRRRAELIDRVKAAPTERTVRARPIDALVQHLGPFQPLDRGQPLSPLLNSAETPETPETSGSFTSSNSSFPGGIEFWGDLDNAGRRGLEVERWWLQSWTCSFLFPPAPSSGKLYYRFALETDWDFLRAYALFGLINSFFTFGSTPDVLSSNPFDSGTEATALPFYFGLPQPDINLYVSQPLLPVEGSIAVEAGKSAAIGLLLGIDAGIARGFVEVLGGRMRTRLIAPGEPPLPSILGKFEYRFEPDWWVKAIGNRLEVIETDG